MEKSVSFGVTDYVIMAVMLSISMAIGVYFAVAGRKHTSQEDYLLGGRNLGIIPVGLSLFATFNSAVSLLGIPAEVYTYGTMAIYIGLGYGLATSLCTVTLLPLIYPLRITSIYEYLQLRFDSKGVRLFGACLGMIQTICYMTIALLSPAMALQTAAGLPLWMSLVTVGVVGTIYTAIGGIKSVVWTDAFQSIIIFGGIIATVAKGCDVVGGMDKVWKTTEERGRLIFDQVDPDPRVRHTIMGCVLGIGINWLTNFFGQSFSQRLCSIKSEENARKMILMVTPLNVIYVSILVFTGMTILVYFDHIGCDPMAAGFITNANQLMPYFVIRTLGFIPGLSGLYISTIFSGALSTLSSGINALAANTVEDLLYPVLRTRRESTVTTISRAMVFLYGAAAIGLAYLAKGLKGPLTEIVFVVMGGTGGPVFGGLFLLGAVFPQANKVGACTGCLAGLAFCLWLNVAKSTYGAATPTLPYGPTDTCQDPSIAAAGLNETSLVGLNPSRTAFNQSLDETGGGTTVSNPVDPSSAMRISKISYDDGFHLYDISYIWVPLMGILISLCSGLIISKIYELVSGVKRRPKPKYIFPFMRRIWYKTDECIKRERDGGADGFMLDETI